MSQRDSDRPDVDGLLGFDAAAFTETGPMFALAGADQAIFAEACCTILADQGIDGRALVARLRQGETLGSALGLPPELAEQLYERAHRWFAVGRPERAEPLFRALCVAVGDDADYWVGLGVCLRLRDDAQGAALAFATAERLRPSWSVPAFHAAEVALRTGDLALAAGHLARFERLRGPDTPESVAEEARKLTAAIRFRRETEREAPEPSGRAPTQRLAR